MKPLLLLVAGCMACSSYAEERNFIKRVNNNEGEEVPYASVFIEGSANGYCPDSIGGSHVNCDADSVETINGGGNNSGLISIPNKQLYPIPSKINTGEQRYLLAPVMITSKKEKRRTGIIGCTKARKYDAYNYNSHQGVYGRYEDEYGVYLQADASKKGILKEVSVYITDDVLPESKFRLRVYSVNPTNGSPQTDITDTNLVVQAAHGNQWVRADLSNKYIPIKNGIYITVEWITGHYYYPKSWTNEVVYTKAQVIGMVKHYCKKTITAYRKVSDKNWKVTTSDSRRKQYGVSVYATYSYVKK